MTQPQLEIRINDIEKQLIRIEEQLKSNAEKLICNETKVSETLELVSTIRELAVETKYTRQDINAAIIRLEKLEASNGSSQTDDLKRQNIDLQKQADKWDKFKWLIVAGCVTVICGLAMTIINIAIKVT